MSTTKTAADLQPHDLFTYVGAFAYFIVHKVDQDSTYSDREHCDTLFPDCRKAE